MSSRPLDHGSPLSRSYRPAARPSAGTGRLVAGFVVGLLAGLAVVSLPAVGGATDLLAVRHWSAPDHTRIVVDISEPTAYLHRALDDPPRIAVDIAGGRFLFPLDPIPIDDGLIRRLRFNVLSKSGKGQVVLDLEQSTPYDVFALEPYQSKPNRVVIDVKRRSAIPRPPPVKRPRVEQEIGPEGFGDFLVMIDPGHGGEDSGRRNPDGTREKVLALQFARDLKKTLDSRPGFRADLTRDGDYFVSLRRRREIAERHGAHLFVSLHFNAAPSRSARGTEVFFVSLKGATLRAVRELVQAENSADLVGGLPPADRETQDDLTKMLVDLRQSDSVERSQQLALALTDRVGEVRGVRTRPVKQAGFAVLKSLFIPAVLVEIAFLSNPQDLRFVKSKRNRERYVDAMADGIVNYCETVEIPRLGWRVHTVRQGDSLSKIAHVYAMSLDSLREANEITGDKIRVGQKLRVRPR